MSRSERWLPPALLLALCYGLYAGALDASFQFDDTTSVVENPAIRSLDPRGWWRFWSGRVLTYGSFALDWRLHGLQPLAFRVGNVAIHTLAALAAAWLATGLLPTATRRPRRMWTVWTTAAVFAAHPLQTQAVTYIVQRAASLCGALYLAALAAYLHARRAQAEGRRVTWGLPLAIVLGAAACLAKEMAITLPLAVWLVDAAALPAAPARWRRVLPMLPVALLVPLAAALGGSFGVAGGELTRESAEVGRGTYALTQIDVVTRYLRLLVLPIGQNVDPDVPWRQGPFAGSPPLLLLAAIHTAWIAGAMLAWRRGQRLWGLGAFWLLLTLAPESSLFPIRDAMFEHRMYLPMFGPALLAGLGIERLARRRVAHGAVAALLLVGGLGAATVARNRVWSTPETLWRDAAARSPDKGRPHLALGAELGRQGRWTEAAAELERALALRPDYEEAWTNLGNVRLATGDLRGAILAYRSALAADPGHLSAWRNLGAVLDRAGDLEGAAQAYEQALRRAPTDGGALNGLAAVRLRQGRAPEALPLAQRAAALGLGAPRLLQQIERTLSTGGSP